MLHLKNATIDDCLFVARGVAMALHIEPSGQDLDKIAHICSREDVLYSYRNAMIAWIDGERAGLCLCYDGSRYRTMRDITFPLFADINGQDSNMDLDGADDETCEGEYYIDSVAVMPEFRRRGIAGQLIEAQMTKAKQAGFVKASLLVDPANPNAQTLYRKLGFIHNGEVYAFGQTFWKWIKPLD